MDRRATIIVWSFLLGVIALEGWATLASFAGHGPLGQTLMQYMFGHSAPVIVWGMGCAMALLYAGWAAMGSAIIRRHVLRFWTWRAFAMLRIAAIAMALVRGFFEEALFRRTLMDYAMHLGANGVVQIAISALAFGAVHAIWGVVSGNFRGAWNAMLSTGALGAGMAILYIAGGRAIGPCIAAHILINLLLEPWLIITSSTNGWSRRSAIT